MKTAIGLILALGVSFTLPIQAEEEPQSAQAFCQLIVEQERCYAAPGCYWDQQARKCKSRIARDGQNQSTTEFE